MVANRKQIHKDSSVDGANLYNLLAQRRRNEREAKRKVARPVGSFEVVRPMRQTQTLL